MSLPTSKNTHKEIHANILNSASGPFSTFDTEMMSLAISLAKKGEYSTTPNPNVGCVLVDDAQTIVGKGFHQRAGQGHAEVNALRQAGKLSQGATAYVSLEPCAHYGRTGPCAGALIEAGIKQVIIACTDPNPLVAGKGIAMLQQAGVDVRVGLLQEQAEKLNRFFFFRLTHKRPFITVKLASSLDGKTALANGESKWITSPEARADVQIERAKACAILTGADTVLHDNPQLNVRPDELPVDVSRQFAWRQKQPLRVVVDSKNRLTGHFKMLCDGHASLVYNHRLNETITADSCQQMQLPNDNDQQPIDLLKMLEDLAHREINHVWVEAGAKLSGALFDLNLVDQLVLYQAPKILGKEGKGLTDYHSPDKLKNAMTGVMTSMQTIGPDIKLTVDFSNVDTGKN